MNGYLTNKLFDSLYLKKLEEFEMMKNSIAGQKWWKIGAAAFLTVGLLGACGDGEDQDNMDEDVEEEMEEETE